MISSSQYWFITGCILFSINSSTPLESENYQNKYTNKLTKRCNEQIKLGANRCIDAFRNAYDDCYKKLPSLVNYLLCWPMKIDYACNIIDVSVFYLISILF